MKGLAAMDFSVRAQRWLAEMEQDLAGDRRLTGLAALVGAKHSRPVRWVKVLLLRMPRPRFRRTPRPLAR